MIGMILAAGMGTRLKPWTDFHPKALVPINGKPIIHHVIENLHRAGISTIVINLHHLAQQIIDYIQNNPIDDVNIIFSDEREKLLDTGGAIVNAYEIIKGETILVHNADIFTDLDLNELIHSYKSNNSTAVLLTSTRNSSRKLLFDNKNELRGWINLNSGKYLPDNLPQPNDYYQLSFNGIHILSAQMTKWLYSQSLEPPFSIIPMYVSACSKFKITAFTPQHEYKWFDIGKPETLIQARLSCCTNK